MTKRINELILRIKTELDDNKWTEADLAREAGISSPIIYRLMGGQRGIRADTLKAIGKALKIPTLELAYYIGLSDDMPSNKTILNDVFVTEWMNASEQRRNELLNILRTLNAIDKDSKGVSGRS